MLTEICVLSRPAGEKNITGGATLDDLRLMRKTVSERVQVKAAHGVRDYEMAVKVRSAGATRFGTTQTEKIMEECYRKKSKA
jgi:deoxyribose-phosphate aldolase